MIPKRKRRLSEIKRLRDQDNFPKLIEVNQMAKNKRKLTKANHGKRPSGPARRREKRRLVKT